METQVPKLSGWCRAIDAVNAWLGRAVSVLVVAVTLIGAANAVLRYLGRFAGQSLSSNAWLEFQWYLFALVFLLGAAVTLRDDAHVRVDVFLHRLSPRGRAWVNLLGTLLFLIPFCVMMLWVSWNPVWNSWSIREGSPDPGGLPRWPIKAMIPVAFLLLMAQGLVTAARAWAVVRDPNAGGAS